MFIEKFAYVEGIYGRKKTRVQGVVCQKIPPKQVLDKKTILPPTVLICLEKVKKWAQNSNITKIMKRRLRPL